MNLTAKEKAFLLKFAGNDIVSDYGWQSTSASAWTADLCKNRSDAAVLGSLITKKLMNNNGESVHLTDSGREALKQIKAVKS